VRRPDHLHAGYVAYFPAQPLALHPGEQGAPFPWACAPKRRKVPGIHGEKRTGCRREGGRLCARIDYAVLFWPHLERN